MIERRPLRASSRGELRYCRRGHPMDVGNSYVRRDGRRECRACQAARGRERRACRRLEVEYRGLFDLRA